MGTGRKLWLGFGTLMALFALVVAGVGTRLQSLGQGLTHLVSAALPLTLATHEMETESSAIGTEVMWYLETRESAARQRLANVAARFEHSQTTFHHLAEDTGHGTPANRIAVLREEYSALGQRLMDQDDALQARYLDVARDIDAIRAAVRADIGVTDGAASASALGAMVSEVGAWLGRYLQTGNATYKQRLLDAGKHVAARLRSLRQRARTVPAHRAEDLRARFTHTMAQVEEVVLLHDVRQAQMMRFGNLRAQLEEILNEVGPSEHDLTAATAAALSTVRRFQSALLALLVAGSAIGLATSLIVARAVLRTEETWRLALGSIGGAVIATDDEGRVKLVNAAAQSLTGWTQEEAAGQPAPSVLRIVEEATREPIDNPVDAVLRNRIGLRLDYRGLLVARDGTETAIEGSASPMRNDRGVVVGVALSLRTITTRQHTAAGGLRAAAPPRDEFLATLAHELRNPLAAIRNALELMRVHGDATGPHEIIRRQVAQMARLVDDQIDVADPSKDPTEPPQPLALAPARPCPVPPDSGAAANGGLRVVVVDDNEDAAASLGTLLELWGYNVRTEHEGAHAVQAAVEFDPDVVLLDIGLPGLDGYTVARRMRAHRALEHVFLVAITGWGQPEDRRRSHEAGFDRHLVKPVDLDALRGLLASVDSERSQHAATLIHGGPAT